MDNNPSFVQPGQPFKYCSKCGAKIDKDATICPSCGTSQESRSSFTTITGGSTGRKVTSQVLEGLTSVRNAALVALIGIVLGIVGFASISHVFLTLSAGNITGVAVYLVVIASIGIFITIISAVLYREGFKRLSTSYGAEFSVPTTMKTVYIAGIVLLLLVVVGLIVSVIYLSISGILGLLVVLIFAGILAFIGFFVGLILGLWRVGSAFNSSLVMVGAILMIIPYLDILGVILVLAGVAEILGKHRGNITGGDQGGGDQQEPTKDYRPL